MQASAPSLGGLGPSELETTWTEADRFEAAFGLGVGAPGACALG